VAHACTTWEAEIEKTGLRRARANTSQDPISNITRVKWTESVAQAIECLCKALNSNPNPEEKKYTLLEIDS
jgi:hypothetical protein